MTMIDCEHSFIYDNGKSIECFHIKTNFPEEIGEYPFRIRCQVHHVNR